jgi:hypothetical protein
MDHLGAVFAMMGEPHATHDDSISAWERMEARLGVVVPDDYRKIVDTYAPVQVNWHLYLGHPADALGAWMEQTIHAFRGTTWDEDVVCPGFEATGPVFGGENGMVPLADTDRGEYVFAARESSAGTWRILACDGDEQDFYEYRMGFAEWLHGYFTGGDMVGPESAVFYPGALRLERPVQTAGEHPLVWHGPDRGR